MTGNNKPLLVAIDDGYAQTKLWGEGDGGKQVRFMMRSSARPGRYSLMSLSGDGSGGSYRTEEGEEFTVSAEIEGENTQFDGFHTSPMNRVLVHHALAEAGYSGRPVRLVTGLPVSDFFSNGRKNDRKIEAKKANLRKGVSNSVSNDPLAFIAQVDVGCQALAAFVDYWLDSNLKERDVPVEKVAVVDVGGRTTDVALILDGQSFDPRRSGTENVGVLDVYTALADLVQARFNTRDNYPLAVLDRAIRTGTMKLWGKQQDVHELVAHAVQEQQTKIAREVERRLGNASDIDAVLFVGGGSALFTNIARMFPNGAQADDPEFANARGLYKYIRYFAEQG
jgi:plasmid segregation protein ParM